MRGFSSLSSVGRRRLRTSTGMRRPSSGSTFEEISPSCSAEYVRTIRGLVQPDGWLLACFFPVREGAGGPPFPATRAEIEALWTPHFRFVEASAPPESAEGRQGLEWLVVARPRD